METLIVNVRELDQFDRSALERLVRHELLESERLVIQVMNGVEPPAARPSDDDLPAWSDVYEGLSDSEIDELDAAIVRLTA